MLNRSLAGALVLAGAFLLQSSPLPAQTYNTPLPTVNDKDVALLRQDLRAKAKQLITKNMQLTDSEAERWVGSPQNPRAPKAGSPASAVFALAGVEGRHSSARA